MSLNIISERRPYFSGYSRPWFVAEVIFVDPAILGNLYRNVYKAEDKKKARVARKYCFDWIEENCNGSVRTVNFDRYRAELAFEDDSDYVMFKLNFA